MSRGIHLMAMLLALVFAAPTQAANVLVTDLSKDQISIRSNFAGEKLLLFGAIDTSPYGPVDGVVVVLRGPSENVIIRKKQKQFGIWINGSAAPIGPLPSFYALVSSTDLDSLTAQDKRQELGIGAQTLSANALSSDVTPTQKQDAMQAFLRLKKAERLFASRHDGVEIIDDKLFRAEITLPTGMPVGRYVTEFFAFKSGRLIGYQTGELPVDIVGTGHILHRAAYERPLVYGLAGVVMALFMGWAAAALFSRR